MQKLEAVPVVQEPKKGLVLGKGKLPEEQPQQAKPTLKPPTLITPEEVVQHLFPTFFCENIYLQYFNAHFDF